MPGRLLSLGVALVLLAALAGAIVSACYDVPRPDCGFVCGAGNECPDGYACASDRVCHRNGTPDSLTCRSPDAGLPAAADAGRSDAPLLDAAVPDAAVPDAAVPDAVVPDAAVPDAAVPDAAVPDAAVPDAVVPDAAIPDAVVPDAASPAAAIDSSP